MHTRALEVLGVAGSYVALDVAASALADTIARVRGGALEGLNVTIPHKVAALGLLDTIGADAAETGAVNTIVREGSRLVGENTDVEGLSRALDAHGASPRGRSVVVLGAGGAARAAVSMARRASAREIVVAARDPQRARALVGSPSEGRGIALADRDALREALARADLVVQASSATMPGGTTTVRDAASFVASLPLEALGRDAVVTDLVYRPRETALLFACRERGLRTLDGVEMLVWQGALALARWLGRPVEEMPVAAMRDAVLEGL